MTEEELDKIIGNVGHGKGHVEYRDFLMASVDLSKTSFLKYCERAFERFFSDEGASL